MPSELVVMKFGGTSVATPEKIERAAQRAIRLRRRGRRVVVVVSAPGKMTDELIASARQISANPDQRELDMLMATGEQISISLFAIACRAKGVPAVSLTGPQAGIYADALHTRARIVDIQPGKILQELARGRIVVVAGFQGINPNHDITTLGRGGSDLTAVALAAALHASRCDIYTDVEGVYTTDPRIVSQARLISHLAYDEMLEMAASGAQVMQARSIEVAKKFQVPIRVVSAFSPYNNYRRGSWITEEVPSMEQTLVRGVALDLKQALMTLRMVPDKPGTLAKLFGLFANAHVNVDMITQSAPQVAAVDVSLTLPMEEIETARKVVPALRRKFPNLQTDIDAPVAKLSVVGVGMRAHSGVASQIFGALARQHINIKIVATSEIKVSCIVERRDGERGLKALHRAFRLHRSRRS